MPSHRDVIEAFFKEYEHAGNTVNTAQLLTQFADNFMVAAPHGTTSILASDFITILPKRKAHFDQMGCQSARLHSLRSTPIGQHYALVDTTWRFYFSLSGNRSEEVDVDSTFLIHTANDELKIVLYLPHQDIIAVLRDRGITPPASS
jgi:hypothetical protein